jgi:benzoyl-CoA reductase/2-hydroxyglutaryl-CoA dehydratase subunit BcrC/BadD/HgdB
MLEKGHQRGENMKIRKNGKWIGAIVLIAALAIGAVTSIVADVPNNERGKNECLDQLTDDQKDTLQEKMDELRASNASPEEIRDAIEQFMEEIGIEIEDCEMRGFGPPKGSMNDCYTQLTEEQREALQEKMEELREELRQFMEDMGIDVENCGMPPFGREGPIRGFGPRGSCNDDTEG